VCYCNSCRQFSEQIDDGKALDEWGGTDIYQMPIGYLSFETGEDKIKCLHITEGGPYRWYASCCNTLIGNTGTPKLPFIGLIHAFMDDAADREGLLGPIRVRSFTDDCPSPFPEKEKTGSIVTFIPRFLCQMLWWKLSGKAKPNPLFDEHNQSIVEADSITR
jgi:hypothetical protein